MEKILTLIKENKLIAIIIGAFVALFVLPKLMRKVRRRKTRRSYARPTYGKRRKARKVYTKGGKAKKPWQIKGSLAAKRHMARLRKKR